MGLQSQDLLQQQDASAQQSQQVPLLLNSTAAERWDGKSKLQKLLEPLIDGFKNVINPIANMFFGAMPTFRGLNTEVSTDKTEEPDSVEEVKKPKEFLMPQPRFIAQRKHFIKMQTRPKKYAELKVDLDRLKRNKDFLDYIKTKKYKHNYPNTYYYPRVKYVLYNPNNYYMKPNNSRLLPYRKPSIPTTTPGDITTLSAGSSEWKPIAVYNATKPLNMTNNIPNIKLKYSLNNSNRNIKRFFRKRPNLKRRKRIKRDISSTDTAQKSKDSETRGFLSIFDFITDFFTYEPVYEMLYKADHATKTTIVDTVAPEKNPPFHYSFMYNILMITVDVMEGLFGVQKDIDNYYFNNNLPIKKKKSIKRKSKPKDSVQELGPNDSQSDIEISVSKNKTKQKKLKNKKKKLPIKDTIEGENATAMETPAVNNSESTPVSSTAL